MGRSSAIGQSSHYAISPTASHVRKGGRAWRGWPLLQPGELAKDAATIVRHLFDQRVAELRAGRQAAWADLPNESVDDAGSQEFRNWICLAGVVPERQATVIDYLDTWIFNSQKCFALFEG